MKKPNGYETTQAYDGSFERLDPGGYICQINGAKAEEYNGRSRIAIAFDIASGPLAGYYKRKHDRFGGNWPGTYRQFTEDNDGACSPFFKGMITAIEESNGGFRFDFDESKLVGKLFGGVFAEEEYMNKDGDVKTIVRCSQIRSTQSIQSGDFQIPSIKKLRKRDDATQSSSSFAGFTDINPDDIPF